MHEVLYAINYSLGNCDMINSRRSLVDDGVARKQLIKLQVVNRLIIQ